eukprot:TRINITY_DN14607_c0_g1_i2.p1 TRINITY_DN14607_c0_g1~~TRINITY_DN14607_c0_g1_i2.p1  ORF type:complete len:282 (+),score=36.34 TRINITY_DN14607_c0_g1_i2:276-1121(+)
MRRLGLCGAGDAALPAAVLRGFGVSRLAVECRQREAGLAESLRLWADAPRYSAQRCAELREEATVTVPALAAAVACAAATDALVLAAVVRRDPARPRAKRAAPLKKMQSAPTDGPDSPGGPAAAARLAEGGRSPGSSAPPNEELATEEASLSGSQPRRHRQPPVTPPAGRNGRLLVTVTSSHAAAGTHALRRAGAGRMTLNVDTTAYAPQVEGNPSPAPGFAHVTVQRETITITAPAQPAALRPRSFPTRAVRGPSRLYARPGSAPLRGRSGKRGGLLPAQ